MKIALGLVLAHDFPAPGAFWESYERAFLHLTQGDANAMLPPDLQVTAVRRIKSTMFPVDCARNEICRDVLAGDEDWLFFMDADHIFPPDVVARLLSHRQPVVTARYHTRRAPFHAVVYVKHRLLDGPHRYAPVHFGQGLIEIERCGAGALLIRRDVLEKVRFQSGENWFRYQKAPDPPHDLSVSEDFWFCRQVREAGFKLYCDWDVEVSHLAQVPIGREQNLAFLDAQMRALDTMSAEERQKVADSLVVIGYPDGLLLPTGERVSPYQIQPGER